MKQKKITRAQKEEKGNGPKLRRCSCGATLSKFALKEHKANMRELGKDGHY